MKKLHFLILIACISVSSFAQVKSTAKDKYGNVYTFYTNDPSNARWYTMNNGLTVILSENKLKPRVQTLIATKAGSSSDPADNTGLAHYLEHLLFKGTDVYGTKNFEEEKVLLDQIDNLYEQYNSTKNEEIRKEIYRQIDSVSNLAAKFSIANEYDKMVTAIGAQGTNAFTSFEQTVYVNDIPANQINNWIKIEAERFRNPVLRLFHTELEAVYEEKNISLDNDNRKVYEALLAESFPNHNYGRQTTIGTVEHLKNPSIKKIRAYFKTYYVPNNMAIIMAGDIDAAETFITLKQNFAYMQSANVPKMKFEDEVPLRENKIVTVEGPDAESLTMGFRAPSAHDENIELFKLMDLILSNSSAGLIDLNLVKAQKCLYASCSPMILKDRGLHYFSAKPLEGQSLQEVQELIYGELEKLKNGEFDMELVSSIVLNQKVDDIKKYESYQGTAYSLLNAFTSEVDWSNELSTSQKMLKYSKEDITNFAKKIYNASHVVIYKVKAEKKEAEKIEKPQITQVEVNRGQNSGFAATIMEAKPSPIVPQVLDFQKEIIFDSYKGSPIWKVKNGDEQLFTLYYILDIGSHHDLKLAHAVNYLEFLGTDKYTSDQISEMFYKLACDYGVSSGDDQSYVYLSGLAENFDKALALFEHLLKNAKPDAESLQKLNERTLKSRTDAKLNKRAILQRLQSYAQYGYDNPSTYLLSEMDLKNLKGEELVKYIQNLTSYNHKIWYSGPLTVGQLKKKLAKYHKVPKTYLVSPTLKEFPIKDVEGNKVFFAHYEMVQAELSWLKKANIFNAKDAPMIKTYNEYFGGGMSSIVFQEIRESKALAYSTYSFYSQGAKLDKNDVVYAYVGTQADKFEDSYNAMTDLLNTIPRAEGNLENAKTAIKQELESSRILKTAVLFTYDRNLKKGLTYDTRAELKEAIEKISLDDLENFHQTRVAGKFNLCVLADREKVTPSFLAKYGDFKELTLEELFGY